MKYIKIPFTTAADGSATAFYDVTDPINGAVYAVQLIDGDLADGVDVTVTIEQGDVSIPVLVNADFNTDQIKLPRVVQSLNTDGSALTSHNMLPAVGRPKVVIAAGGDTKTGAVILYVVDL